MENVKIFVASSSEMNEERKKCIEICHQVNKYYPYLKLEVVEWETDIPSGGCSGRIQDEINPLLIESDIVIVMFYSKVGRFTLEEYNLALANHKKVFLYFKTEFSAKNKQECISYGEVFDLIEQLEKQNQSLYVKYSTLDEFENNVQKDLNLYLSKKYQPILAVNSEVKRYIPFKRNVNFIGRDDELRNLHDCLQQKSTVSITGIAGLGGIGKTQLATEYALGAKDKGYYPDGIYWVDSAGGIYDGLYNLCSKIGRMQKGDSPDEIMKNTVRSFCLYLNQNPNSLLIMDNLGQPHEIFNEMPIGYSVHTLNCKIIFTTRNGYKDSTRYETIDLNTLNIDKCIELFKNESCRMLENDDSPNSIEYAQRICETLGCFPLAVIQACAYLKHFKSVTLKDYVIRIENEGGIKAVDVSVSKLKAIEDRHKFGIEIVLKFSWEKITEEDEIFFMKTVALFPESAGIPVYRVSFATGIEGSIKSGYASRIDEIIETLYEWRLLEKLEDGKQIRLHPLIREFVRGKTVGDSQITGKIAEGYLETFQKPDVLVGIIKSKSIYDLLDEIYTAIRLLEDNSFMADKLRQLHTALSKNAYQINTGSSFQSLNEYPYQYLHHAVYHTTLEILKENLNKHFKDIGYTGVLINENPQPYLEHSEINILTGHESSVLHAEFSKDGKRVVSCSSDNTVRIWDAENGRELYVLNGHEKDVNHAEFSIDSKRVVSCSIDKTVRIWDAEKGGELYVLKGHDYKVNHAEFSIDGKRVVSCSSDRTVRIWNAENGTELYVLKGHEDRVNYVEFSIDGKRVVSCSEDNTVRIWDAENGRELYVLKGHKSWVGCAKFSVDDKRVVSCSYEFDSTVRIWDVENGKDLYELKGHEASALHAEFTVDGKRVVSYSFDGTVRIWDAENGRELYVLRGHEKTIKHAEFSGDGKRVISFSDDNTVRIWNAETGKLEEVYYAKCLVADVRWMPEEKSIYLAGLKDGIGIPIVQKIKTWF